MALSIGAFQPGGKDVGAFETSDTGTTTPKTLTYTAVGTSATIGTELTFDVSPSMTATGTSTFSKLATFLLSLAYTATGTSTLTKIIHKLLAFTGVGTSTIQKDVDKTLTHTAIGTSVQSEVFITEPTHTYTATGLLSIIANFVPKPVAGAFATIKRIATKIGIGL